MVVVGVVVVVVVVIPKFKLFKKSRFDTAAVVSSVAVIIGAFVVSSNSSDVIPCFMFCKA